MGLIVFVASVETVENPDLPRSEPVSSSSTPVDRPWANYTSDVGGVLWFAADHIFSTADPHAELVVPHGPPQLWGTPVRAGGPAA